ncbi:MAG: hypothetical protein E7263_01000 [Lachnospiraceae bacterium]|nr:hypothetical protein [Lachnospiraceae bacterium]
MRKGYKIALALVVVALGVVAYLNSFKLEEVKVSECEYADEELIATMVKDEAFADNTLALYLKCKLSPIDGIQFVNKIEIDYLSKNTVSVTVYEKALAGCVEYMNSYIYFDKDGIVLESSSEMVEGVPFIKGLEFDRWEVGKKLPIEDERKFKAILNVTQLIEKYELDIDGIKFTASNELVLTHDKITIELGEGEYLEIQMMNLGSILEGLKGKEGTLNMKDFDSDEATASFK